MAIGAAIALGAASAYTSIRAANQADEAAELGTKASAARALMAKISNTRNAYLATEQARQATAQSVAASNAAIGGGAANSSAVQGSVASIRDQLNSHLQYLDESSELNQRANEYARQSAEAQSGANNWNALGSVFATGSSLAMSQA